MVDRKMALFMSTLFFVRGEKSNSERGWPFPWIQYYFRIRKTYLSSGTPGMGSGM
jgi:hypothetical protein